MSFYVVEKNGIKSETMTLTEAMNHLSDSGGLLAGNRLLVESKLTPKEAYRVVTTIMKSEKHPHSNDEEAISKYNRAVGAALKRKIYSLGLKPEDFIDIVSEYEDAEGDAGSMVHDLLFGNHN